MVIDRTAPVIVGKFVASQLAEHSLDCNKKCFEGQIPHKQELIAQMTSNS